MSDFESLGVRAGIWSGLLRRDAAPGRVTLVHLGEAVAQGRISAAGEGQWRIDVTLPPGRISEGVQNFLLMADNAGPDEPMTKSERLADLPIIAGTVLDQDLRAELDLLRAELDLLKREFRRFAAG